MCEGGGLAEVPQDIAQNESPRWADHFEVYTMWGHKRQPIFHDPTQHKHVRLQCIAAHGLAGAGAI